MNQIHNDELSPGRRGKISVRSNGSSVGTPTPRRSKISVAGVEQISNALQEMQHSGSSMSSGSAAQRPTTKSTLSVDSPPGDYAPGKSASGISIPGPSISGVFSGEHSAVFSDCSGMSSSTTGGRKPSRRQSLEALERYLSASKNQSYNEGSVYYKVKKNAHLHGFNSGIMERVADFTYSPFMETLSGMVIMFNFILIIIDTNATAKGEETEQSLLVMANLCFAWYILEFIPRVMIEKWKIFNNNWNILDCSIIVIGTIELILDAFDVHMGKFAMLPRVFRLCRLLRLLRAMKLFASLKELRKVIFMMSCCAKTLFWSFLLMFVVMTIWATVAVELLHPLIQDIADGDSNPWEECPRCRDAYSSVWHADVTFLQTIVAGDSWGKIAVPVIMQYPATILIFAGSLFTTVYGVLNLIVAVMVDTSLDTSTKANELEWEEAQDKKALAKIFTKIDADGSGNVSFEELKEAAGNIPEFCHRLRVMDIDSNDLKQLFQMLDVDGSGEIDSDEFIDALYRMQNTDSKTAARFTKHMVTTIQDNQNSLQQEFDTRIHKLEEQLSTAHMNAERRISDQHSDVAEAMATTQKQWNQLESDISKMLALRDASIAETLHQALDQVMQSTLETTTKTATAIFSEMAVPNTGPRGPQPRSRMPSSRPIAPPGASHVPSALGSRRTVKMQKLPTIISEAPEDNSDDELDKVPLDLQISPWGGSRRRSRESMLEEPASPARRLSASGLAEGVKHLMRRMSVGSGEAHSNGSANGSASSREVAEVDALQHSDGGSRHSENLRGDVPAEALVVTADASPPSNSGSDVAASGAELQDAVDWRRRAEAL